MTTITLEQRNAKLDEAKALILAGWCQGHYGMTEDGDEIDEEKYLKRYLSEAVSFCGVGAVCRVTDNLALERLCLETLELALEKLGFEKDLPKYNDAPGRTRFGVAALFDHAREMPL